GLNPDGIPALARKRGDVLGFVEIHIEQGPVLEAKGLPVGVVTAIAGCTRLAMRLEGEAGHAGTVPMPGRRDALAGAAECALAVERLAAGRRDVVATVGQLSPEPGAINVIPGAARFSVDARAPADGERHALVADIERAVGEIAGRRKLGLAIDRTLDAKACACTPWIIDQIEAAVSAEGVKPLRLVSGAGHDAMAMADLTDVGMLFVRCERGVSHNPAEAITAEDAGIGARVLLRLFEKFRKP
ncbi:MAG: hydantoinase/carbamoylase family amidase, partial [Rhodospirillales bacterium]